MIEVVQGMTKLVTLNDLSRELVIQLQRRFGTSKVGARKFKAIARKLGALEFSRYKKEAQASG